MPFTDFLAKISDFWHHRQEKVHQSQSFEIMKQNWVGYMSTPWAIHPQSNHPPATLLLLAAKTSFIQICKFLFNNFLGNPEKKPHHLWVCQNYGLSSCSVYFEDSKLV